MIKILKLTLFIIFYIYQTSAISKTVVKDDFNHKYLSSYLSGLISQNNQQTQKSVKYFNSSKLLNKHHEKFLKEYTISLVLDGQIKKSISLIKQNQNKSNSNFFEARLLLLIDNFKKGNFSQNISLLSEMEKYRDNDTYSYIIYEVLNRYNNLFLNNELNLNNNRNLGNLSLINEAFEYCYLNKKDTNSKFNKLIKSKDGDYSRYLFFYLSNLIENNEYSKAVQISNSINILDSNLLILQSKNWIDNSNFEKFKNFFSCENETDIIAEFFFIISNFLAVDKSFEESNFYSNISNYLNPKFYFNLTHLLSNYYENNNFKKTKRILKSFSEEDKIYYWFKLKKIAQIIENEKSSEQSLSYIEEKFKSYSKPSVKIIFDMANIYKRSKEYEKSIKYYSEVLEKLDINSTEYGDVLYNRGASYERLGDDKNSDRDLLKSLTIKPDDPYILNYLGYSWLEREYKIQEAIEMLDKAYNKKKNDPFIIDSVGWGYYLIGDFINAEKFLRKAIQLMPKDPIVNDHYGDVLWKLNRKIQARYYWESAINSKDSENEMKQNISKKMINGLTEG